MALRRCDPLFAIKVKHAFKPYFLRVQDAAKKLRYRQLPFLEVSKEPTIRPALPDPRRRFLAKVDLAALMNITEGDRVQILYGNEKGKQGIVGRVNRDKNQVLVTGANLKRTFWHPEPGPGRPNLMSVECPIHITNVVLLDPVTKQPTRVKRRYTMNGECVRISKVSGCAMPDPVPVERNEREELWAKHRETWWAKDKARRGPMKEDVFGNKEYFKALVRIVRDSKHADESRGGARGQLALEDR
mmetsp:Transcript_74901/g.231593  ORF Transcript_74901/g.231593 Transcript_74901/m.231593 type:complete len:244 (-) Transcript_74901:42-773(-)|eukprot:CAMPEP_0204561958 /NCGR_PEP_ID=MMETSP0661-20131031/33480_1 /ASSEMBLY_ACC=CAM_ASM_000606 /TAXON_ID=109239 /ORGANISM="Alexandrium margalefi, Strain AMGDE01CS-322" /LENGTH=243 /DNA_ID=CAMNT_0051569417 /DNA_START=45 /DNA_END=776 /DNA_ORIENTATION=-